MSNRMLRWFDYAHLPLDLQAMSKQFHELAINLDEMPESPEKTMGLRKLLESKDCFVRAVLETKFPTPQPVREQSV